MTPHRCRLPTADQLRARLQGLMDEHDVLQKELAIWLGCSRLSIYRRFTGWRGLALTVEDAREIAAAILLRGDPTALSAGLRADLDTNARELLAVPQLSDKMIQTLMGVTQRQPAISKRRIRGLVVEGFVEPDGDGWRVTESGAALISAQGNRLVETIAAHPSGISARELANVTGWPVGLLSHHARRLADEGRIQAKRSRHPGDVYLPV